MTVPKERPILFAGAMVRAILDGRKTQTRRIAKDKHTLNVDISESGKVTFKNCPYGQIGDRLWVRETWSYRQYPLDPDIMYAADWQKDGNFPRVWKPSIHMFRKNSRILLEITDIRLLRLHEISETDARDEGVKQLPSGRGWYDPRYEKGAVHLGIMQPTAKDAFAALWEEINGKGAWLRSPWVWAITFKRVQP
jgi:hypothetical protein